MSAYEAIIVNGKTVFVLVQQAAQPLPQKALLKPKAPYAKRISKKCCERKSWW